MAALVQPGDSLRVAVVGGGSISREFALHHFGAATGTVVSAIVDLDEARAKELAVDVGSVQAGASIENGGGTRYRAAATDVRGDPVPFAKQLGAVLAGCDVVYIGTTPGAHAALAIEALEAGKHVLLEKPLAALPADADAIVAAAEAARARGQHVGMNIGMRWNPGLHELRRLALGPDSTLGALTSARLSMHYRQWPREWQVQPWCAARAEGGPLREVGTHFFFGLMELFGHGSVKRVRVAVEYPDGPEGSAAETSATGVLELKDGLVVSLSVRTDLSEAEATEREARGARSDVYELEVVGESGTLILEDFSNLRRTQPAADAGWIVEDGSYGRVECVQELVAAVAATAAGGGGSEQVSAGVTVREGRNAQRLLDAVLGSGGEWLDVCYD
jgi:predicted dehydrogenase